MKEKFYSFMQNNFIPVIEKITRNKYLNVIKDSFIFSTPFVIVGSFILLFFNLPLNDPTNFMYFKPYETFVNTFAADYMQIFNVSMGLMSVFIAFSIGYSLAGHYGFDQLTNGLLSLYSFILLSAKSISVNIIGPAAQLLHVSDNTNVPMLDARYMDAKGVFVAIIAGILSVEISRFLINKKIMFKLPESVPPIVSKSFEIIVPVFIISVLFQIVNVIVQKNMLIMLPDLIIKLLQPLFNISDSVWYLLILSLFTHLLWFCGIHGGSFANIILQPIVLTNIGLNQAAFAAGQEIPKILAGDFHSIFCYIGGAGATLGLSIAMLTVKNDNIKSIGKISIVPSIFNINEPIIFALPIVMNPIFAIPFILAPTINIIISWTLFKLNIIPKLIALTPYTTPPVLSAFISTNFNFLAPLLVIVLVTIDYFIYKPFLSMYIKELEKEESTANQ